MSSDHAPAFRPLSGIYEPSAIQQLPDGRFLVVEDEKEHPLSLVTLDADADGEFTPSAPTPCLLPPHGSPAGSSSKLGDLEGLAVDRAGFVYAITSHSRDDDGHEKKSREKLARFRVEGDRILDLKSIDGLKQALTSRHALLADAALVRDVKDSGGLNIEGLEVSPDQQQLLIGFRTPLRGGRALIARIENPVAIFESGEAPRIAPVLDELDLDGHGIRGLSYVPALGAYLVIAGPTSRAAGAFAFWRWSGEPGTPAVRLTVPGLPGLGKAEGVCPALLVGRERIVVVSDDGSAKAGRPAGYLVLDPARLQRAT